MLTCERAADGKFRKISSENEDISFIFQRFDNNGFEVFLVGGCVRDIIRGEDANDFDMATNADPNITLELFRDCRIVSDGIKHGTVRVILGNNSYEITTYRTEKDYSDGRHPGCVEFVKSIENDLSRRDFTVNAIAWNPSRGFVDLFGGTKDIGNKILRCVGNPEKRFNEDALRILRALRFKSKLCFSIDADTEKALFSKDYLIKNLSAERIRDELIGILCGENCVEVLRKYAQIIFVVIPELKAEYEFSQNNPHHVFDVYEHTLHALENTPSDTVLRFAVLFHDIGKPYCYTEDSKGIGHFYGHMRISAELADKILTRLKFDGNTKQKIVRYVELHDLVIKNEKPMLKKLLRKIGMDGFKDLISVKLADAYGQAPDRFNNRKEQFDEIIKTADEIEAENQCFSLKSLVVKGDDLLSIGIRGRKVGEILEILLAAVIDEKLPNEKSALLDYVRNNLQNY